MYRRGRGPNITTTSPQDIFKHVTLVLSDLVIKIRIRFISEADQIYKGKNLSKLPWKSISYYFLGRCFSLSLAFPNMNFAEISSSKDILGYIHYPGTFMSPDSTSKFKLKINERLYLTVSYEVSEINTKSTCRKYTESQEFDDCIVKESQQRLMDSFSCVLPFSNSSQPICNDTMSQAAFKLYIDGRSKYTPECPSPCHSLHAG
jgi:hypothetical protein